MRIGGYLQPAKKPICFSLPCALHSFPSSLTLSRIFSRQCSFSPLLLSTMGSPANGKASFLFLIAVSKTRIILTYASQAVRDLQLPLIMEDVPPAAASNWKWPGIRNMGLVIYLQRVAALSQFLSLRVKLVYV